jgi:hypothetical protein
MAAIRRTRLMETMWEMHRRFVEIEEGYAVYRERTSRDIPVVLLEPVSPTVTA